MSRSGTSNDIDEIAASWAVRSAEGLSPTERSDLDAWLERDTRHSGAFIRAQAIWSDLDRIAALESGGHKSHAMPGTLWSHRRAIGIAASVLMFTVVGAGLVRDYFSGRYVAEQGEVLRVALNDNSTVMLNTDSVMQVRFDEDEREIYLRRGEASFDVAHDLSRPFVVHAGDVAVRAVGTQFAVQMNGDSVEVTVSEGVVEVLEPGPDGESKRRLIVKNDQLVASARNRTVERKLEPEELSRELSWRNGLLIFDGETLATAAAEVNRYSSIPVTIADPALAREEFVGVFKIGNVRAFAQAAATAFDARVNETPEGISLERAETDSRD